jgi:DNA-binding Lrp family transcriptional regulator
MKNGKDNEKLMVLSILKSPEIEYSSNSIAKLIGISSMGALKIAKRLEKEGIIIFKQIGKAKIIKINYNNEYAKQYLNLVLRKEAEHSNSFLKRWINDIRKIKNAKAFIIYGSILKKYDEAKDVDVIFVINKNNFSKLKKEIDEINLLNIKKIHPLYQTKEDLINNIKKEDKVILNALKGIIINGYELIIDVIEEAKQK